MSSLPHPLMIKTMLNVEQINGTEYTHGNNKYDAPIHIGTNSGLSQNNNSCIAIGMNSGGVQTSAAIAIGKNAGSESQGSYSVAIGTNCGKNQGSNSTAVGDGAGEVDQAFQSSVYGSESGAINCGDNTSFFGADSGALNASVGSCGFGMNSLNSGAGINALGFGQHAAPDTAGSHSITLNSSGVVQDNKGVNTIVINAQSQVAIETSSAYGKLFIAPIETATPVAGSVSRIPTTAGFTHILWYNPTTKEVRACQYAA